MALIRLKEWRTFLLFGSELGRFVLFLIIGGFIPGMNKILVVPNFPLLEFVLRVICFFGAITTFIFLLDKIIERR